MRLKISLKARLKQLFCKHDRSVGWSCVSKGINRKEGHWYVTYACHDCGMAFGEWVKESDEAIEKMFGRKVHEIG